MENHAHLHLAGPPAGAWASGVGPAWDAPEGRKVLAEYIYLAGDGGQLASRTVVLEGGRPSSPDALPPVELATEAGEVFLRPRSIYADPLRGGEHVLVLCDAWAPPQLGAGAPAQPQPHTSNTRAAADELLAAAAPAAPAFTAEQEYFVLDPFTGLPPGVFAAGVPVYVPGARAPGGCACGAPSSYGSHGSGCDSGSAWGSPPACGGAATAAGAAPGLLLAGAGPPPPPRGSPAARRARQLAELHMRACIKAGLRYAGAAAAAPPAPGQHAAGGEAWAYRIGPCAGVDAGDQLCVARYLLRRIGEELDVDVSLRAPPRQPPPGPPDWGGTRPGGLACALEFSAGATRGPGGDALAETQCMLTRLQAAHAAHAPALMPSSPAPAGPPPPFTVAVGDRRAAVSIPSATLAQRAGPFVDRRPAADCDPYLATSLLAAGALGLPLPGALARAAAAAAARGGASPAPAPPAAEQPSCHQQAAAAAAAAAQLIFKHAPGAAGGLSAALAAATAAAAAAIAANARNGASAGGSCDDFDSLAGSDDGGSESSDEEGSQDMLVSEIRRMDRLARRAGGGRPAASAAAGMDWEIAGGGDCDDDDSGSDAEWEGEEDDSACSQQASAASGPAARAPLAAAMCAA